MFNNNKLSNAVRTALFLSATLSSASLMAQTAQETEVVKNKATAEAEAETEKAAERIQITGSRLSRVDIEPTRPVTFVGGDYISQRGMTNAQDAVTDIPGVFAAASPEIGGNTAGAGAGVGQRTINIYGLGSQRTLTLVNGSRFVSSNSPIGGSSAPGGQIDVNNIPVALIDRVEVVKVGGAAVYGSDAVAGVVNYVLKKDYEGAEFSVDNKSIGSGLGDDFSLRGVVGGNFDNERGNSVFGIEFNKMDNILAKDVPDLRDAYTMQTPTTADRVLGADGKPFAGQLRLYPAPRAGILSFSGLVTPGPSAATNVGVGAWAGKFYQFDPKGTGSLVPYNPGTPTGNTVWASGGDGLNLNASNTAQEGYERWNFTNISRYQLNDFVNVSSTFMSSNSNAENPGYQAARYNSSSFGALSSVLKFDTTNPYLISDTKKQLETMIGGPGVFYMHKGWLDLGQRQIQNESSVNSIKLAFDGEFNLADRDFNWEASYQKGWSSIFTQTTETNDYRFLAALDVGINPTTNKIDCKMNYVAGYGENLRPVGSGLTGSELPIGKRGECFPLNPFGLISPEAFKYMAYNDQGKSRVEQEVYNSFISTDLFELPAGMVSGLVGFEYRKEFSKYDADASASLMGLTAASIAGSYDTSDWFTELAIPVISSEHEIPFIHNLSFETSYRTMDNSRAGSDNAWALGMNLRPIEEVMIRGNLQATVRAPAITELFQPVLEGTSFASDPCDARFRTSGPNPAARQKNCDALGIPANFVSLAANASRRGISGGNINLTSEQSKSSNIGIIYSPEWLEGFSAGVDYVEIEIEDAIVNFTLTNIMEACYDDPNSPNKFCNSFKRGPDFQLPALDAYTTGYVNASVRSFRAVEYSLSYANAVNQIPGVGSLFGETNAGELRVDMRFYNQKKNLTSNTGFDKNDITGQHNSPDWRSDLRMTHSFNDLTTLLDVVYEGEGKRNVFQTNPVHYIGLDGQPFDTLPSRVTVNLSVNYQLTDSTSLRARVDNLTDWAPDPSESAVGRWDWGRSYNLGLTTRF
jgi:iron complex outermembrane receptor protein